MPHSPTAAEGGDGLLAGHPDLDPCPVRPSLDELRQLQAAFLRECREIEYHRIPSIRGVMPNPPWAIGLPDRAQLAPIPRPDDDLARRRDGDRGELIETDSAAVRVDEQPYHEGCRRSAGPDPIEVALHRDDARASWLAAARISALDDAIMTAARRSRMRLLRPPGPCTLSR